MALLDILTGHRDSSRVPPLAKGLGWLLGYSKLKQPGAAGVTSGPTVDQQLEDFFKPSPSGGPTAKGVVGALLTGGLMDLVQQFRGAGKAEAVDSWVSRGPNTPVSASDMSKVLTEEQIAFLMARTGLSRQELLDGLSERLPQVVDELTPDGRLPTSQELRQRI